MHIADCFCGGKTGKQKITQGLIAKKTHRLPQGMQPSQEALYLFFWLLIGQLFGINLILDPKNNPTMTLLLEMRLDLQTHFLQCFTLLPLRCLATTLSMGLFQRDKRWEL